MVLRAKAEVESSAKKAAKTADQTPLMEDYHGKSPKGAVEPPAKKERKEKKEEPVEAARQAEAARGSPEDKEDARRTGHQRGPEGPNCFGCA